MILMILVILMILLGILMMVVILIMVVILMTLVILIIVVGMSMMGSHQVVGKELNHVEEAEDHPVSEPSENICVICYSHMSWP